VGTIVNPHEPDFLVTMKYDQSAFREKLVSIHGRQWHKAWLRLSRKASALKQALRKRSKMHQVLFEIELEDIKKMFYDAYGESCKYCDRILNVSTMVCDHIIPLSKDGESTPKNLQIICKQCNTRKGPLKEKDFCLILAWVKEQTKEVQSYILKKLAKGGKY